MSTPVLVIDGRCGFCARSAQWALRLGCRVEVVAWQDLDLEPVGLTAEEADAEVHLLMADLRYAGHEAAGRTLMTSRHLPVRMAGRVVVSRPVRPLARRAYAWVAAHRHQLPGGTPLCAPTKPPA